MIDREARSKAKSAIEKFINCEISNFEFIDQYPSWDTRDIAIKEIFYQALDPLCDDLEEHLLKGEYALNEDKNINIIHRVLLFLESDLEYKWPPLYKYMFLWLLIDIPTFFLFQRLRYWYFTKFGDINFWPFISEKDYLEVKKKGGFPKNC